MKTKTIEMVATITGTRDGVEWPARGGRLTCPEGEAADLIAAGLAREIEGAPAKVAAERAVAPKGETRKKTGLTKASMG